MIQHLFSFMPYVIQVSVTTLLFKEIYSRESKPAKGWWKMNYVIILLILIISIYKHWIPFLSLKIH